MTSVLFSLKASIPDPNPNITIFFFFQAVCFWVQTQISSYKIYHDHGTHLTCVMLTATQSNSESHALSWPTTHFSSLFPLFLFCLPSCFSSDKSFSSILACNFFGGSEEDEDNLMTVVPIPTPHFLLTLVCRNS
jgi:hypothetical protein